MRQANQQVRVVDFEEISSGDEKLYVTESVIALPAEGGTTKNHQILSGGFCFMQSTGGSQSLLTYDRNRIGELANSVLETSETTSNKASSFVSDSYRTRKSQNTLPEHLQVRTYKRCKPF